MLRPSLFNDVLARVKGSDTETLVNEVVLRSQAQAEYSAENYGHFGLALRRYAHFTSPIRRYADLIVHRALIRALKLGDGALPETADVKSLNEISARISAAERRAMAAERETVDRLIAHHLADRIGATFEGRIGGVTRAGLFVKLDETGADGFIPARNIGDDYYPVSRGPPRHDRTLDRRNLSPRRPRHGAAGGGHSGRRRAALRSAFERPQRTAGAARLRTKAAPGRAAAGRKQDRLPRKRRG